MKKLLRHAGWASVLAVLACAYLPAHAQKYPAKPIRMIVPFAPGGGTDIVARIMAQKVSEAIGQPVVVDNRSGAGGTIGAETTVRAAPDGYTLIMVSGSYGTNAALYKLPYDPVRDIQPVVMIGDTAFVAAFHPAVPVRSVKDLIAYARANPGKLNYGSTGIGGITHLATELFDLMAGTRMMHIPYKGTGPAINALLGGQIQLIFGSMPATAPHVKSGKLRGIGVTTTARSSALPDVPPIADAVPGYDVVLWYGIWGPKGMPREIVTLWNREVAQVLQTQEMKDRLAGDGIEPAGGPPEQFRDAIRRDVEKWKKVVRDARITLAN